MHPEKSGHSHDRNRAAADAARDLLIATGASGEQAVLRAVLDTAVDAIVTIDSAGTIEVWNKAAERLFGYAADEVVGRNVSMLMPEPHASRHDFYVQRYLTTGKTAVIGKNRQLLAVRKDGTTFPMELAVSEFPLGHRRMFTGIVRDISDRRKLERQILEVSVAEQRRIGQDLHDGLCQQLTAISYAVSSLQRKLTGDPADLERRTRDLSRMVNEAIDQARALSRGLCPIPVDAGGLAPALRGLVDNLRVAFGVACRLSCDDEARVTDTAAATHLYRITQEATTNAVRHGRATEIDVRLTATPSAIVLTITDDGVGIPPADQRKGGIGLHIMNYRTQLVGGSFDVRAGDGKGTVVTCTIPSTGAGAASP